jgi:hypothetical protein
LKLLFLQLTEKRLFIKCSPKSTVKRGSDLTNNFIVYPKLILFLQNLMNAIPKLKSFDESVSSETDQLSVNKLNFK